MSYGGIRSENWPRYKIGDREDPFEYLRRVRAELANLELASRIQWNGRRVWGSHTYSGGCWICDTIGVAHGLMAAFEAFLGPDEGETGEDINGQSPHPVSEAK